MEITHYRVKMVFNGGKIETVGNTFTEETYKIVAENDEYVCLDDYCFTSIKKKSGHSIDSALNKKTIYSHINDRFWGTQITYTLYTDKKKRRSTIKRELKNYIDKEFSFLNNIDMSFLED